MKRIHIAVAGAFGRMGQEVCRMVEGEESFRLAALIDPKTRSQGEVSVFPTIEEASKAMQLDVLIDFTTPKSVMDNTRTALLHGIRPVVGTTGLSQDQIDELDKLSQQQGLGTIIAPNFAIGAVLMMKFAQMAARYLPHVEIIEMHHDKKLDAPSGTAVKTAELIQESRQEIKQGHPEEKEVLEGARGAYVSGFRIHSVRLPGYVAHQEVIFGDEGQILTLRHDSIHRSSFMPGVKLAAQKVMELKQLVYGLENILD